MTGATRRSSTRARSSKRKAPSDAETEADASAVAVEPPKQRHRKTDAATATTAAKVSNDTATASADSDAAALPTWVHSLFSPAQREQWSAFVRTSCLARVGADFFDLFELAHSLSRDQPLNAFVDLLGLRLSGLFELLFARAVRGERSVMTDKPLCVHGRFFVDPPEVTTLLRTAPSSSSSEHKDNDKDRRQMHWGYFRDTPDATPAYVVQADDSATCAFRVAGSSLFHVLDARLSEQHAQTQDASDSRRAAREALAAHVTQYLRARGLASVTPASLRRKRSSEATAASLHGLGIVVPYNAKTEAGYRELPVVGEQLAELLARVKSGDASARKTLSGLITRATIANDECDFGTSLLLGLDLFAAGAALEKESLQLLRVAYMLLRRGEFGKVAAAHAAHRRAGEVVASIVSSSGPKVAAIELP